MRLNQSPGKKIEIHVIEDKEMTAMETSALIQLLATWVIRDIEKGKERQSNALTSNRSILTFVQKQQ